MAEHKITILNRITMPEAGIELVCNNPTDTIRFEFDDEWSGIAAKMARFSWDNKYKDVPFSGNVVEVPDIYQTNHVFVGVFADNIASTPAKVKCRYSIKCLGGKVIPPSEDVYAEIIALINAGINANDGVGVSNAYLDDAGHLFITLTTGESIDCGKAQGKDGKDGKDGAGAEEYTAVLKSIEKHKTAIEQNTSDISELENDLSTFEKNRPFNLTGNSVQVESFEGIPLNPVTVFEPKQVGNGDPYPAGGGRNKLVPNVRFGTKNGIEFTLNADGSWTVKGTATAANAFFNLNYVNNTTTFLPPGEYILSGSSTGVKLQIMINGEYSIESVGGEHVRFTISEGTPNCWVRLQVPNAGMTVDKTVYPMVRLATDLDESYAPPSNIRPITGYDKLGLNHYGKNLCTQIIEAPNTLGGVTWTPKYDTSGKLLGYETIGTASGNTSITHYVFFELPAGTYIVSGAPSGSVRGNGDIVVQNETYDAIARAYDGSTIDTFTLTAPTKIRIVCQFSSGTVTDGKIFKPMIRLASIADDTYEPYHSNTYAVQLGQTVYGGRMDWLTGKLTLEWGFIELGGNTQFYSANTMLYPNGERIRLTYVLPVHAQDSAYEPQLICNQFVNDYKIGGWGGGPVDNVWILAGYPDTLAMALPISVYGTTEDSVRAKFAETPLQVAYKLKTPTEIQLTPHEILALSGTNTLYGDGEINISGRTDMQAVVSNLLKRIAALEVTINS